jgi:hypothetical protein
LLGEHFMAQSDPGAGLAKLLMELDAES